MKKTTPTLSIITVTKNREKLLKACLTSLVGQCKRGDEIIIVDASTDNTSKMIASFTKKLPIRYVRYLQSGYPAFYNEGAKRAQGDILVFFDDDCIATPTFLSRIRKAHTHHTNSIIQGMSHSIPKGNIYVDMMSDHYKNWLSAMILHQNTLRSFDSKNASIPRALFWKYSGFSSTMDKGSEDIEFGLRLRRAGVHIYLDRSIIASHHERTTWDECIKQHKRFAASEGHLDRILPSSERLGAIPRRKLFLHIRSFFTREIHYIRTHQWKNACILPVLYITLAHIRLWGYATHR